MSQERQETPGSVSAWKHRQIDTYPAEKHRKLYLLLVVMITVVLYYELFVGPGVMPLIMRDMHLSFATLGTLTATGALLGSFASLSASFSDKIGRANLVIWGQLVVACMVTFGMPSVGNVISYALFYLAIGLVEGFTLIVTVAMVRDFSPQVGRATAMGFWTIGPVGGIMVVYWVSSLTLEYFANSWRSQFRIAGIVGFVMFAISFLFLRELAPALRDQKMVDMRDRMLIELKAKGLDVVSTLRHPWRQMVRLDIVIAAVGVSTLLLFYTSLTSFGTIYFVALFKYTVPQAGVLLRTMWMTNVVALVVAGILSDKFHVRKPFMLAGSLALCVMIWWWSHALGLAVKPSFGVMVTGACALIVCQAFCYTTWMACYTEMIEEHNPALTATGLALWGWIGRIIAFFTYLALPLILKSTDTLLGAKTITDAYKKALIDKVPPSADLVAAMDHLKSASANAPGEWQIWFWISIAGALLFAGAVFLMHGRWSPTAARKDQLDHDALVDRELSELRLAQKAGAGARDAGVQPAMG